MEIEKVICGRALVNGELTYTEVGINDGRIVAVGKMVRGGDERVELGTSDVLLPGFIDPHVHFRDPGMTQKEDFQSGSMSAINAGVTCVLDMPNTKPPVSDHRTLMDKKSSIRGRSYVDYGLFVAVTPGINAGMLAPMVPGFKLFMGSTTGNILLNDDSELIPAVRDVLATGKRMSVHAEDDSMMGHAEEHCTRDHLRNRPAEAEWNAISRLGTNFPGSRINVCHVTTTKGLDLARGFGFTTEVTLHHMLFDVDRNTDAFYKVNPPIRNKVDREGLMSRFLKGDITMVGTDHAPHTLEEKMQDFDAAPGGIPGVETTVPIMMGMVRDGLLPMSTLVGMAAESPGSCFGMRKGAIKPGFDADFTIFDLRKSRNVDVRSLHSRCGHSPYGGMSAVYPDTVILRGEVQVEDGEFCGESIGADICG